MDMLATIRAQREEISKRIAALRAEEAELDVAERVVARLMPVSAEDAPANARPGNQMRQPDMIISTLNTLRSHWVRDWSALQQAIVELFNVEIPKSSLQPHLSNLKNEGLIVRDGARIALRSRVEKGAGPQSDNSFDPATAAVPDDEDRPPLPSRAPPSLERLRERAELARRSQIPVGQKM